MNFLGNLLGAVVDVALTPVEVLRDIVDPDPQESHTVRRLQSAAAKLDDTLKTDN